MFGSLGFTELILVLFIVLIIFGAGKLPQLGEGVGKAIRGFKKSVHEAEAVEADTPHMEGQAGRSQDSPQPPGAPPAGQGHSGEAMSSPPASGPESNPSPKP